MFRVQAGVFEMIESIAVNEFAQFFSRQHLDFLDFVRCAEAVEEVHERNAAFDGRQMGNGCQVGTFLDAGTAEHSPAVLRQPMTSEWSPKMDMVWVPTVRAAMCRTTGFNSPDRRCMTGIISIRPCDAVKDEQSCPFPKRRGRHR